MKKKEARNILASLTPANVRVAASSDCVAMTASQKEEGLTLLYEAAIKLPEMAKSIKNELFFMKKNRLEVAIVAVFRSVLDEAYLRG